MNQTTSRFLLCAALLGFFCSALGQPFSIESFHYDKFAGIITLRWASVPERVWSVESSTNLTDWHEVQFGPDALLRVPSSNSNRTEVQFDAPADSATFYRLRKLAMTDVGTLTPGSLDLPRLFDVNDLGRIVGDFDGYNRGEGFTWAPGGPIVSFGPQSEAIAVNNQNMVVGYTYGGGIAGLFSWTPAGGVVKRGEGIAADVNEAGHILGYETRTPPKGNLAFLWKPSSGRIYLPDLDPVAGSTHPAALGDAGHVVGNSRTASGDFHAFIWTEAGGMVDLGGFNSSAIDVNNNGQVIGTRSLTSGGVSRGFFWSASAGMINFPAGSYPSDINNQGQVSMQYLIGSFSHGAVWSQSGGLVDLGTFQSGTTYEVMPGGINELGQVVGVSRVEDDGVFHQAFFWSPSSGMVRLETLGARQPLAFLINNNGVIFGTGNTANYQEKHAVMWDPILPP